MTSRRSAGPVSASVAGSVGTRRGNLDGHAWLAEDAAS